MAVPLVEKAHQKIAAYLQEADHAVDATMGNGYDTVFLAENVGQHGKVYAFDLQSAALTATDARLKDKGLSERVNLIQDNHKNLTSYLANNKIESVRCIVFNLGYLPGSDKNIQTSPQTTVQALNSALLSLQKPGIISVLAYTGHIGGRQEAEAVKVWAKALDKQYYRVTIDIPPLVKQSPPELILVESI